MGGRRAGGQWGGVPSLAPGRAGGFYCRGARGAAQRPRGAPAPRRPARPARVPPMPSPVVRLAAVTAALPPQVRTSAEVEACIAAASPGFRLRPGTIEAVSGVRTRRVAAPDVHCSDLAAEAARAALAEAALDVADVGLVVFASASQDLFEPATAHLVQAKLGTRAAAFDVKNACNSFLDGLQVAEALVAAGTYDAALVVTGEVPSRLVRWPVRDADDFRQRFAGFTMGDAGAAALLVRDAASASGAPRGIFHRRSTARSEHWPLATVPSCGSMHPGSAADAALVADGARLKEAFLAEGPAVLRAALEATGRTLDDFARILVHQATLPYLDEMCASAGLPRDRVEVTIEELGNMASASLPVACAQARARGALRPGDRALWIGLASGIGIGIVMTDV